MKIERTDNKTTDQKVGGSNPLTHAKTSGNQGFQRLFFCLDKVI